MKGYIPSIGKETWKILSEIRTKGHSYFFNDWLDLILNSLLQLTESMTNPTSRISMINSINDTNDINDILKGQYNDRYMEIVEKYKERDEGRKIGERTIDLFASAWGALYKETLESGKDVIGEIFQAQITYGEHGQFFTPEHITEVMAKMVGKDSVSKGVQKSPETVMDPCCGSGRFLLSSAKNNPNNYLIGQDIDERCCKMAVINLWIFDLNGEIRQGDSLARKIDKRWIIRKGGFIYEDLEKKEDMFPKQEQTKEESVLESRTQLKEIQQTL